MIGGKFQQIPNPNTFLLKREGGISSVNFNTDFIDERGCFADPHVFFMSNMGSAFDWSVWKFNPRDPTGSLIKSFPLYGRNILHDISPDGNSLLIRHVEDDWDEVWLIPKNIGKKEILISEYRGRFDCLRFSKDGKSVFVSSNRVNQNGVMALNRFDLGEKRWYSFDFDSRGRETEREVVDLAMGENKFLVARSFKGVGSIELWDPETLENEVLDFGGARFGPPQSLRWSKDGRRFLFLAPTASGQIALFVANLGQERAV